MSTSTSAPDLPAAPPAAAAAAKAEAAEAEAAGGVGGRAWENVGADVLLAVLQRVATREWAVCCCVCRHWRRTAMDASLWQTACLREFAIRQASHSPLAHLPLHSLTPPSSSPSSLLPPLSSPFHRLFPRAYLSPHRPYLCLAARLAHVLSGVAKWRVLIRYRRSRGGRSIWAWRAVPAGVVMQGGVTVWVAFDLAPGGRRGNDGTIRGRSEEEGEGEESEGEGRRGEGGGVMGEREGEAMEVKVQGLWSGLGATANTPPVWITLFHTHGSHCGAAAHGAPAHGAAGGMVEGREWVEDEISEDEEGDEEAGLERNGGGGGAGAAGGQWERVQQSHMTGLCLYSGHDWSLLSSFFRETSSSPPTTDTTPSTSSSSSSTASLCGLGWAGGQQGRGDDGVHGVVFLHAVHVLHCFPLPLPHTTPLCSPRPNATAPSLSSSSLPSPPSPFFSTHPCPSLHVLIDLWLPLPLHLSLVPSQAQAIALHALLFLSPAAPPIRPSHACSLLKWEGDGWLLSPSHGMEAHLNTHACTHLCSHPCTAESTLTSSSRDHGSAAPPLVAVLSDALADVTIFSSQGCVLLGRAAVEVWESEGQDGDGSMAWRLLFVPDGTDEPLSANGITIEWRVGRGRTGQGRVKGGEGEGGEVRGDQEVAQAAAADGKGAGSGAGGGEEGGCWHLALHLSPEGAQSVFDSHACDKLLS
ncbi:hypothetical protein CLOM_g7248 [Closterium sp. NIES-68]|nr:hypothetical protein CLOM_g7248 [Closterium sp. NIES-68]GJP83257.1 hypothetical protein CLOP_g13430 [Closterium sp. NIES-67]